MSFTFLRPEERLWRWRQLTTPSPVVPLDLVVRATTQHGGHPPEEDPFDTSGLEVSPPQDWVEQHVSIAVKQWNDLDARKLLLPAKETVAIATTNHNNTSFRSLGAAGHKHARGNDKETTTSLSWGPTVSKNRLVLPHGFDYTNRRGPPSGIDDDDDENDDENDDAEENGTHNNRWRVLSLADPTQTLDYETELWHLFNSVPPYTDEKKRRLIEGSSNSNDDTVSGETGCRVMGPHHSIQLHQEIQQGLEGYLRLDAHALGRCRMSEWHHFPPLVTKRRRTNDQFVHKADGMVIRVECLRRQLIRGSSPSADRFDLELEGTQTLLDLHSAICDMWKDPLSLSSSEKNMAPPNGVFFIEDTLYTTEGPTNYAKPLLDWLVGPTSEETTSQSHDNSTNDGATNMEDSSQGTPEWIHPPRRNYLGITSKGPIQTRSMSATRFDSLQIRLGMRYCHVCSGDVECCVIFTDVRPKRPSEERFPILHDVWTPHATMTECEACQLRPAVVVDHSEGTDGGPTALCSGCHLQLFPDKQQQQQQPVYPLQLLQDSKDTSMGHEKAPDALFQNWAPITGNYKHSLLDRKQP